MYSNKRRGKITPKNLKRDININRSNMEDLIGKTVLKGVETSVQTNAAMKGKRLVLLYFSASWCPPCQAFTPLLKEFYEKCCRPNQVEIIFISSDQDTKSFNEYFAKMPWISLPGDDKQTKDKLSKTFGIEGIPHLVVLDAETGHCVTNNAGRPYDAKSQVQNVSTDVVKGNALIASWKAAEAVPIEDVAFSEKSTLIGTVIAFLFKHPMLVVALLFHLFKKFKKSLKEDGNEL